MLKKKVFTFYRLRYVSSQGRLKKLTRKCSVYFQVEWDTCISWIGTSHGYNEEGEHEEEVEYEEDETEEE